MKFSSGSMTDTTSVGGGVISIPMWAPESITQGTWVPTKHGSVTGAGYLENTTAANADRANWKVFLSAGTYRMDVMYTKKASSGIVDIDLGGVTAINNLDTYNSTNSFNHVHSETGITVASSGVQNLLVRLDGKNGSSSAHESQIQSITLTRTA